MVDLASTFPSTGEDHDTLSPIGYYEVCGRMIQARLLLLINLLLISIGMDKRACLLYQRTLG
jgi:hypothetical protein